jgi:hypothetical protein
VQRNLSLLEKKTPKKRKTTRTKDKLNFLVRKPITISSGRSSLVLHLHNKRKNLWLAMFGFETRQSVTSSPTEAKGTSRKKLRQRMISLPSPRENKKESG